MSFKSYNNQNINVNILSININNSIPINMPIPNIIGSVNLNSFSVIVINLLKNFD